MERSRYSGPTKSGDDGTNKQPSDSFCVARVLDIVDNNNAKCWRRKRSLCFAVLLNIYSVYPLIRSLKNKIFWPSLEEC